MSRSDGSRDAAAGISGHETVFDRLIHPRKKRNSSADRDPHSTAPAEDRPNPSGDIAFSATGENDAANGENNTDRSHTLKQPKRHWTWTDIIVAIATIVIAATGIFSYILSKNSLIQIERSTAAAQTSANAALISAETMQNGQRACITFSRIENEGAEKDPSQRRILTIVWQNTGQSPALKIALQSDAKVVLSDVIMMDPLRLPTPTFRRREFLPEQVQGALAAEAELYSSAIMLTEEEYALVRARRAIIYVYGLVQYRDIFARDVDRHTEVCVVLVFAGDGQPRTWGVFTVGPQNDAT